jgi:hypothetical protein
LPHAQPDVYRTLPTFRPISSGTPRSAIPVEADAWVSDGVPVVKSCLIAGIVGSLVACRGPSSAPPGPPHTRAVEEPPLTLSGDWSAEQGADVLWTQTALGDEWVALQLAQREGPEGLLARAKQGGVIARTAALAWPYVPTSWAFRGEWCAVGSRYEARDWAAFLTALSASAAERETVGEELTPEHVVHCERWLQHAVRTLDQGELPDDSGSTRDALAAAQTALLPPNVVSAP